MAGLRPGALLWGCRPTPCLNTFRQTEPPYHHSQVIWGHSEIMYKTNGYLHGSASVLHFFCMRIPKKTENDTAAHAHVIG